MSVAYEYGFGPYTVADLQALPDEGKSFELVDGWLIELSPSTRDDFLADRLRRILEFAAHSAGVPVYIQAPMDISTPAGARKPDVAVIDATAAAQYWIVDFDPRPTIQVHRLEGSRYGVPTTYTGNDVLTVTEPFPVWFAVSELAGFSGDAVRRTVRSGNSAEC